MNDPNAVNDDEKTGEDDGSAGGGGGAADPLSRRQFLDELAGVQMQSQTPEDGELTPEQQRDIREATREFIMDAQADFEDMLPNGTRSQMQEFARAMLESDGAKIIKIVQEAVRVSEEKEDQKRREDGDDLHVQRSGSGTQDKVEAPKSMGEAVINAGNLFNRA